MEVFICTLSSDFLGEQEKGEIENKSNLKERRAFKKTKNYYSTKTINLKTLLSPTWVTRPLVMGGFVGLGLCASLFLAVPKVHAASFNIADINLVRRVAVAAPLLSSNPSMIDTAPVDSSNDYITKPIVAQTQVTVDPPRVLAASYTQNGYNLVTGPHYFPYGYCTYYVSQKRTVTWSGNAGTWLNGATRAGLATGEEPKPGAIVVTNEGGRVGHVAYVESVDGNNVHISEMNYKGYGVVSTRTIAANAGFVKGYIY